MNSIKANELYKKRVSVNNMENKKNIISPDFKCLGIESSCDETAAAVVKGGYEVLSNVIASQIDIHKEYGGVVPEIASRKHVEYILPVIESALKEANLSAQDIDLIAVTHGPGLVGALLVGVCAAKGMASVLKKPIVGVNHIEGHILANLIDNPNLNPPFISLVASGGHSHIVLVKKDYSYEVLARTRDDAAGEAFDKIARESGLGYPGGPLIDKISQGGNPLAIKFPRTRFSDGSLDFSFSGVKTAALNYLNKVKMLAEKNGSTLQKELNYPDFSASFQYAIVTPLAEHTFEAADTHGIQTVCIAGGVASNSALRKAMTDLALASNRKLYIPSPIYCTDNAAMIAVAGTYSYMKGNKDGMELNAYASLQLGDN